MSLPNLLLYSDYRLFLKEYYETHKSDNVNFSYRYLSQKAGINSSAFYKYIIDGKRNLTKATLLKTCVALKLNDKQAEYFENLVFFNQAKTIKEKNLYFDKLTKLRGNYDTRKVKEDQFAFYSEWYHSAIRELLECLNFKGNFESLASRLIPAINPKDAESSVALLTRLGLIHRDAQGRWKQTDPVLTTGGQVDAQVVMEFQKKMMKLGLEAFERAKQEERLMSATTFAISNETLDLFKKKIREMKAEFLELARLETHASRVYQLNLNLFPLFNPSLSKAPLSKDKAG
jgi:uncharacterized protein (TIGR02147 family)